jgi:hypothetical protein
MGSVTAAEFGNMVRRATIIVIGRTASYPGLRDNGKKRAYLA